jgi:hypothetical protein
MLLFLLLMLAVPDNLTPPAGEQLRFQAHATGDQIYECDGSKWVLSGPDAKLSDDAGNSVGSHFKGPTWQWSDGSQVIGKAVANATPDADSIPWLLVNAVGHKGDGAMRAITTVQRLNTKGGQAPATGCDAGHKGDQTRSHYTADYLFYAPR